MLTAEPPTLAVARLIQPRIQAFPSGHVALIPECTDLSSCNRPSHPRTSLPAIQSLILALYDVWAFLHDFLRFGKDEFDVAWV